MDEQEIREVVDILEALAAEMDRRDWSQERITAVLSGATTALI